MRGSTKMTSEETVSQTTKKLNNPPEEYKTLNGNIIDI